MIDFHSHIIPEIDDGSRSIEETMLLIKEAKEAGFSKIICTSHHMESIFEFDETSRKQFLEIIKKGAKELGVDLEFYLGSEIYVSYDMVQLLKEKKASTINGTQYILIELPMQEVIPNFKKSIKDLIDNNYIPIIAHPERYQYVKEDPNWLIEYIKMGVLFQANYASIIGGYGKKAQTTVRKLLKNNMIHFLGSDVHKAETIYPKMPIILQELRKILERDQLKKLTKTNASLVLENKQIIPEAPTKIKKIFGG